MFQDSNGSTGSETDSGPDTTLEETESRMEINQYPSKERIMILKNIFIIMVSFSLSFSSGVLKFLQTSLFNEDGLGAIGLAVGCVGNILGNMFLPAFIIRNLGCKWTMCLHLLFTIPYLLSQMCESFAIILTSSMIAGLGAGPLIVARSTYIMVVAEPYAYLTGQPKERVVARFFSWVQAFMHLNAALGKTMMSIMLSSGERTYSNLTINYKETCGAGYCPYVEARKINLEMSYSTNIYFYILIGIFVGLKLVGCVLIALFVNPLRRYSVFYKRRGILKIKRYNLLLVTIKLMKDRKQQFLVCFSLWSGIINFFNVAGFTAAYVSCGWGYQYVGYVYIVYDTCSLILAFFNSWLLKYVCRKTLITASMGVNFTILVALRFWVPSPKTIVMYFIVSALMSSTRSIWFPMHYAAVGIMFKGKTEAAFGNVSLLIAVGGIVGFFIDPYVCMEVKIYIAMLFNILGTSGYLLAENNFTLTQGQ